jgi:murein DD-endopeptidase MepM/ murein hydrolase activator NlpD
MGLAGDDRVTDPRTRRRPVPARRFGAGDGDVVPFRRGRESVAQRLERDRLEREAVERERRDRVERERERRDRELLERLERRRLARLERLKQERRERPRRTSKARPQPKPKPAPKATPAAKAQRRPEPVRARIAPSVRGPVRKRARAAENRRRQSTRRRGLFWPTAKAGFAVTLVLGVSAALGSVLGLPVPGLNPGTGESLASSSAVFAVDPGTPPGLAPGYVFPLIGPHDFGTKIDRFGAPRYGHVHEGQDIFGKVGTDEVAVHDGVVVDRGKVTSPDSGGRGNYLTIYDPQDNHSFVYMHMLRPSPVMLGKQVHAGQLIGRLGCTGSCDGPHLHFEVRIGKATPGAETKAVDPLQYLRHWPQATPG